MLIFLGVLNLNPRHTALPCIIKILLYTYYCKALFYKYMYVLLFLAEVVQKSCGRLVLNYIMEFLDSKYDIRGIDFMKIHGMFFVVLNCIGNY